MLSHNNKLSRMLVAGGCLLAVAIAVLYGASSYWRKDPDRDAILNTGADGVCMTLHCVGRERNTWRQRLDADNPTLTFQPDHAVNLHYEVNGNPRLVVVIRLPNGKLAYVNPDVPSQ